VALWIVGKYNYLWPLVRLSTPELTPN
jgi:hypothetical protein